MNFVAIDFEAANNQRNSACSIGMVRVEKGKIISTMSALIKPPSQQFLFTHIHGIKWSDVAEAKSFAQLWPEISRFMAGTEFLVAHNAPYDRSVLNACLTHAGIVFQIPEFRCSMKLSKLTWDLPAYKLSGVSRHLGIALKHHEAMSDAQACARIVLAANELSYLEA